MTGAIRAAFLRGAGAFLVASPFLPLEPWFGPQPGTAFLVSPGEWALGLCLFGGAAWLLSLTPLGPWAEGLGRRSVLGGRGPALVAAFILLALLVGASAFLFEGAPAHVDSVAQLFQARIFATGAASAPAPPDEAFFIVQNLVVDGGKWYAQYPPGHAALLAVGMSLGSAWVVPVALSLGTALLLYGFAREAYGRETGTLTLVLVAFSPFFWFMGASFMNHASALFFVALLLRCLVAWKRRGSGPWPLVVAGLAVGAIGIVRPLTGVAVTAAFLPFVLIRTAREGAWKGVVGAAVGALAVGTLYLTFNALTTGDPLVPGYLRLWGDSHGLGFHATPWGAEHTPLTGLRNQLIDLDLLNLHLFEWPLPALLPVGLLFLLRWDGSAWDRRLLVGFLSIPFAYFFYWHRDAYLGPRFLYEGLAFVLPLTARAILLGLRRLSLLWTEGRWSTIPDRPASFALILLVLCFAYAAVYGIPQRFRVHARDLQTMQVHPDSRARAAGIETGLVFVAVSWGNRLIAELRGLGLPASRAERAYRTLDHCDLERLERRSRAEGWSPERLTSEVERMLANPPRSLVTPDLNGDRTLKLTPDRPLDPVCRAEVAYDQPGYTAYTPFLLANRPGLDGSLVFARDLRERNAELRALYADRPAYLWRGGDLQPIP